MPKAKKIIVSESISIAIVEYPRATARYNIPDIKSLLNRLSVN